jgi:glutamate-ammonia-ligase adenylyltransferase
MHIESSVPFPETADARLALLTNWQLVDLECGQRNLLALMGHLGKEGLAPLLPLLERYLPGSADPDRALNNLERFLASPSGRARIPSLLENEAQTLDILLNLFAASQMFSDLLVQFPDYLDMLRIPLRRSPDSRELRETLQAEVEAASDEAGLLRAFRRFRHRQLLRIGTNDIIWDRTLEEVTKDISRVADIALDVAVQVARQRLARKFGEPTGPDGNPIGCAVLAFGKLGGEELNYSSDIDLMFVHAHEGTTRTGLSAEEFFSRLVSEVVRLLAAHTDLGQAFRVDLRLRPEGHRSPLSRSLRSTLAYYDTLGRTWERQALIKVRPVAGDLSLGHQFLQAIEPFIYRQYLTFAEINEIKAMKRRIEQKARQMGIDAREVKTGRGGIRDIEFTIQFLQLLNGGDLPELRCRNTLAALSALEQAGCLTDQEYRVLDDAYRFLRRIEHRLQLLFDLQTHRLPDSEPELRKLALRMGYSAHEPETEGLRWQPLQVGWNKPQSLRLDEDAVRATVAGTPPTDPLQAFLRDYHDKTEPTRHILEHLLHQTFPGSAETAEPESDLLLDPNPDPETVRSVLGRYPFRDVLAAHANLVQLAQEAPFLSPRRCRHFLASIAPALLQAIAETPDPDMALLNLEKVTRSLGAKSVLWELFSFNPPSLKLYVELCASSEFLSEILINNPGMIDELLDSLVLNQPRTKEDLVAELNELCRGATDFDPILHSFQDKELLRIGVGDILDKGTVYDTTAALSDLAETLLAQVVAMLEMQLSARYGSPTLADGRPCRFVLVGLGKLGARELSYHSDLDLLLIYEGEGRTVAPQGSCESTDNSHYFTELTQRLIRTLSHLGPRGRLYQVDLRLRPTGKSGSLTVPLDEFRRYFAAQERGAQLWERQTLTRARVLLGESEFAAQVGSALQTAAYGLAWHSEWVDEIATMRDRLETSRSPRDLKRGPGGLADVEFLLQLLLLKYGGERPDLRRANTREALLAVERANLLSSDEVAELQSSHAFLLRVQNRLRMVHNRTLDTVPEAPLEIEKLARRLGLDSAEDFLGLLARHRAQIRRIYRQVLDRHRANGL